MAVFAVSVSSAWESVATTVLVASLSVREEVVDTLAVVLLTL